MYLIAAHGTSSYDVTGAQRPLESNEVIRKANNDRPLPDDSMIDGRADAEQTVYVFEIESESNEKEESLQSKGRDGPTGKIRFRTILSVACGD